jgi:hypothetical protein
MGSLLIVLRVRVAAGVSNSDWDWSETRSGHTSSLPHLYIRLKFGRDRMSKWVGTWHRFGGW